jgi:hypothetical protein
VEGVATTSSSLSVFDFDPGFWAGVAVPKTGEVDSTFGDAGVVVISESRVPVFELGAHGSRRWEGARCGYFQDTVLQEHRGELNAYATGH